jgi:hypothetical protein
MKKVTAIILIAALATTIITQFGGTNIAKATDSVWTAKVGWEGPDYYSVCFHTYYGSEEDRCVGMGIEAEYDEQHPPYDYNKAKWMFDSNCGSGGYKVWDFWPSDEEPGQVDRCWAKYNGIWGEYVFVTDSTPDWLGGVFTLRDNYPDTGLANLNPHCTTICGRVTQYFVLATDPGTVNYLSITVQPFDIVTASQGPPANYSGPAYLD